MKVNGKFWNVKKSKRKNKEYVAIGPEGQKVHFADPSMTEFPGTKRGDSYCARSLGIARKYNIQGDPSSPNFWSRQLWSCEKGKSVDEDRFFGKGGF